MTEEERRKLNARERAKAYYNRHKGELAFREHIRQYQAKYYQEHKEDPRKKSYYRNYYIKNKDKILERGKKWRDEHVEYLRNYQREYAKKKKKKETSEKPSADKIARIFKNRVTAEHYKWLMQNRGYNKESEVEHEIAR